MTGRSAIGVLLEERLRSRGLTQDEASETIGVSQATFSRWIQGSVPKSRYWTAIARFLGIPRSEVVRMVTETALADPAEQRLRALEDHYDRLESKIDRLLSVLDQSAPPTRRRGR